MALSGGLTGLILGQLSCSVDEIKYLPESDTFSKMQISLYLAQERSGDVKWLGFGFPLLLTTTLYLYWNPLVFIFM